MAECAPLIIGGKDKTVLSKIHSISITEFVTAYTKQQHYWILKATCHNFPFTKKVQLTENREGAIIKSISTN
jgi:hypothetical protein